MIRVAQFGAVCGLVNGNMFGGLFARSAIAKLSEADYADAMKLDGTAPFDPMGTGRVMANTVLLAESVMDEPGELASWMRKALDYTATLPNKRKGGGKKAKPVKAAKTVAKTAKRPANKSKSRR